MIEKLEITPGPWYVSNLEAKVFAGENPICAMLWPTDIRSVYETRANANAIAAVPDMLETLIALENEGVFVGHKMQSDITVLIEKATGKSWERIKAILAEREKEITNG